MSPVDRLIEQHILEAELRQRHIDEAMAATEPAAQAAGAPQTPASPQAPAPQGALEAIGTELEKALAAVMEPGHR
ncbi:hypothetical protein [Ideonella oryzae]|uniref:Uncharacterized protein n=1 Tax=Ideonella oryzae TaxID=2937441 RepID=A0ABT1BL91_9BURK|nr:hypothetical protein [Ideonella oryzae]MCO5976980.1 hypothetical protein [Ideonella oryzae]